MSAPNSLKDLLANLDPLLDCGTFLFVLVQETTSELLNESLCMFREREGVTLILSKEVAERYKLESTVEWSMITLQVYSSLNDVGLTAAVSAQLGKHDIPCNVIAAFHHDHVFVPKAQQDKAMKALTALS